MRLSRFLFLFCRPDDSVEHARLAPVPRDALTADIYRDNLDEFKHRTRFGELAFIHFGGIVSRQIEVSVRSP